MLLAVSVLYFIISIQKKRDPSVFLLYLLFVLGIKDIKGATRKQTARSLCLSTRRQLFHKDAIVFLVSS